MSRALPVLMLMAGVGLVPAAAGRSGLAQGQTTPADAPAPVDTASIGVPQAGAGQDSDAQAPMQMTGDTMEYCIQLERRISADPARTVEIRQLARQAHQLCDHGQVRLGLIKMRRAFMMLRRNQQVRVQPQ